jgi:GTPase SAR1 family protein
MNFQACKGVVDDQGQAYRCDLASIDSSWMSKKGILYEAATADFAAQQASGTTDPQQASGTVDSQQAPGTDTVDTYLDSIRKSLKKWMREKTLHNRSELKNDLTVSLADSGFVEGSLVLLCGPKDAGKTFFLKRFMEDLKSNESVYPVYVDMRSGPFTVALQRSLVPPNVSVVESHHVMNYLRNVSTKLAESDLQSDLGKLGSDIASVFCCETKSEEEKTKDLILLFASTTKEFGIAPLLVIDEANMLISESGADIKDGEAKRITEFLVQQTKQEASMNVLLASSLHSYPRKLEKLGVHKTTLQHVLFDELTPPHMLTLLELVGIGPNLIHLLINAYGGHIMFLERCIHQLCLQKSRFAAIDMIAQVEGGEEHFREVLHRYGTQTHIDIYKELADKGWVAHNDKVDDKFYALMNENNVAYTVSRRHRGLQNQMIFDDPDVDVAHVLSTQALRYHVLRCLANHERRR